MGICGQAINEEQKPKKSNLNGKTQLSKNKVNGNKKLVHNNENENKNKNQINENKKIVNNIKENKDKDKQVDKDNVKIIEKKKKVNNVIKGNNNIANNDAKNNNNIKELNDLENSKINEKEIKIDDNICISKEDYKNDSISFNNIIKTTSISEEENILFPKVEQRYVLTKDSNESKLIHQKKNIRTKLLLSFSLKDIKNPKDKHSFGISIINNKYIGIKTFLGKLENKNKKGDNIEYDQLFEIDYIFEAEQILIIEPIINDKKIEVKKEFTVNTLLIKKNYELLIENIGILKISCAKLRKKYKI